MHRYRFCSEHNPLEVEMLKVDGQIQAFLTLSQFHFHESETVKLILEEGVFEEEIKPHEGLMRLPLSELMTEQLLQALKKDQKVVILLKDFEQELRNCPRIIGKAIGQWE